MLVTIVINEQAMSNCNQWDTAYVACAHTVVNP